MHIALISHNVFDGDGQSRVNYELTLALLQSGLDVTLVADRVAPELLEAGARWERIHPRFQSVHLMKVWDFARRVDRHLDATGSRYDAVIACGVVTRRPHDLNVAHFVHGTWLASPYHASRVRPGLNGMYQRLYSWWNARWELRAFRQAASVVAVSAMVKDELIGIGVPADTIEVIVNGVDADAYHPGAVDRASIGLPQACTERPLALFVGDLRSPIKNLDGVLEALCQVPGLHLAVAGSLAGSPYPAMAERLGVADRVHFLGFRRDVAELMRAADFFVLPSRRDSCPLVLLEALASGLPVVTARTVGSSGLVEESGAGFVLERPDDGDALCVALAVLATDSDQRSLMGSRARALAERYSWDRMADQYIRLLGLEKSKTAPQLIEV